MKVRIALTVSVLAACVVALPAQSAPPEGKGSGNHASNSVSGGNGGKGNPHASVHSGQGSSGKDNVGAGNASKGGADARSYHNDGAQAGRGAAGNQRGDDAGRRYDDKGRYFGYFDDHRDRHGRLQGDNLFGDLVYAGITAALAHRYALDFGLSGYSALPPGIRKNLARGKPIPPGIAKKMAPGPLLGRLPRYPGYEWRVAGTDLILVAVATAVVADVLYDVFD
ncbi:anti-virulence regulator CigR family protein [Castellaniella sp.]|uniref:anti-virulence regulator CigR family protein n=1 Tax=Castellaniella sp. TaxID=1955812 RepID=UPI003C751365